MRLPDGVDSNRRGGVVLAAAEERRVNELVSRRAELGNEGVSGSADLRLQRCTSDGKIGGSRQPGDVGASLAVHSHVHSERGARGTPEVGRVDQLRAGRVQLGEKSVGGEIRIPPTARVRLLERVLCREVGGARGPGHVSVAVAIYRNPVAVVTSRASEEGGVDQSGTARIELGDECVPGVWSGRLEGTGRGGEVQGGTTGHVRVALGIHGDVFAVIRASSSEIG